MEYVKSHFLLFENLSDVSDVSFFFFFFALLHSLWDFSSPTRAGTHTLGSESVEA